MVLKRFGIAQRNPAFIGRRENSILHLGTDARGREMWMDAGMLRRHVLVSGTTGSGKSELLLGMMANAMVWGGGGIFVDGKGDVASYARLATAARKFGREGDFYVLNFLTGNGVEVDDEGVARSNTVNPFKTMAADAITQMLMETMDDTGGDGAMWRGRAVAMLTAVIRPLVWLRDIGYIDLNIAEIRDHLGLRQIIDLANPEAYPEMPQPIRKGIKSYLRALPGFREELGYRQSQTTCDQHGYVEMQWVRTLGMMADVYGHIFHSGHSEVDLVDIIRNRRILLVLLPVLEKSSFAVEALGKLVVAMIRHMAAATLGPTVHGSYDELAALPIKSERPFLCVFDEASHYLTQGMDTLVSQSRSLNIGTVFGTQDLQMMLRANPKIASTIFANCGTKIIMRSEVLANDPLLEFLEAFNVSGKQPSRDGRTSAVGLGRLWGNRLRPLQETLGVLDPGEFLLVHGGCAAFCHGPYIRFKPTAALELKRYHDVTGAASEIARLLDPHREARANPSGATPLPVQFLPLEELNGVGPLPGGHVHLRAALKTLAGFAPSKNRMTAPDELVTLGE
ncbi:hypothetical protein OIU34_19655 [Pararhizobium sp. BT-229]|uniref:FtsK/SpoIIIE domain-containing protein n=1 Tax=Pararhizobium sp. BT-229 TaxID=2986923 RepID=UPI0021F735A8|nr:FtsK/SpoIIIE domain-containing protein [Pararhizobium sp. BT-229]MCV9964101.1 hypothetical protein [Pararhizobium sp. BT-229]